MKIQYNFIISHILDTVVKSVFEESNMYIRNSSLIMSSHEYFYCRRENKYFITIDRDHPLLIYYSERSLYYQVSVIFDFGLLSKNNTNLPELFLNEYNVSSDLILEKSFLGLNSDSFCGGSLISIFKKKNKKTKSYVCRIRFED